MPKINIKTSFKWDEDLKDAGVNIKTAERIVEVVKDNRTILIPFESIDFIDFIE